MSSEAMLAWVLLALSSYRLQRIVTADVWPPSVWFRDMLERWSKAKPKSRIRKDTAHFVTCPWCLGFWVTAAVFLEHRFVGVVPMWAHAIFAASAVVGFLGEKE